MEQRFEIHVVFRNERVKQYRGTQLDTMKSCDFLFLESIIYYDNRLACSSQSRDVVFRALVVLSWNSVSARLSDIDVLYVSNFAYCYG